jgi:hypothetical protein
MTTMQMCRSGVLAAPGPNPTGCLQHTNFNSFLTFNENEEKAIPNTIPSNGIRPKNPSTVDKCFLSSNTKLNSN